MIPARTHPSVGVGEAGKSRRSLEEALAMIGRLLVIAGALVGALSQSAFAQFYKGKTITMIINYPAGGPSDIEGRIVAQHLPSHIPGRPTIVIKNVGGAGGVIGANQLGEALANGENMGFFSVDTIG